jgi:tetratricopeptide (TPR) repeat protein
MGTSGAALADEAVRHVLSTPNEARRLALEAARLAEYDGDRATASTAERALGLVAMHLSDFDAAARHLRRALRLAGPETEPEGEARMILAYVLSRQGKTTQALEHLDRASPVLHGSAAAWLDMYRAMVFKGIGRWDDALVAYRRALHGFQRAGDRLGEARLYANRGVLHLYRGAYDAAESDLLRAEEFLRELEQDLNTAIVWHNLGCVSAGRGDAPTTLARFDRAEREYEKHRRPPATLAMDRCEFALSMGLATEAMSAAEQAVTEFGRTCQPADLAEARLLRAQASLLCGDPVRAWAEAAEAAKAFIRQRRPRWAALARYVELHARLAGTAQQVDAQDAVHAAGALERAGWTYRAVEARLTAGRLALDAGHTGLARRQLGVVSGWRRRGPAQQRAQGWQAEALLKLTSGDRRGAYRAVSRGLTLLQEHHAALGAADLRAGAAGNLADLAQLGLKIAADGPPRTVLAWSERVRAAHLLRRPVRPPGDDVLAHDLAELRRVGTELQDAVAAGLPTADLRRRQVQLERAVRDRCRLASDEQCSPVPLVSTRALGERLGERALIEYVEIDEELHALTLVGDRLRLHSLGPLAPVSRILQVLHFLLRRLALRSGSAASLAAAEQAAARAAQSLDSVLLQPLLRHVGDRELVIVPTARLQALCWSLLPAGRQERPVSVAPSATLWHRAMADTTEPAADRVVLVAGPGLPGVDVEVQKLASTYREPIHLTGGAATVKSVLAGLAGARLAHLAAHGRLRSDNPQFSCLQLHDGPLTVYDLEQLPRAPRHVVLSACDTGRGAEIPGGDTLGLVNAFLALGSAALIASVLPVVDSDLPTLMLDLHEGLRRGERPAAALAAAQGRAYGGGNTALAAALICFGAG